MASYIPPVPPYDPLDKTGFSYETVHKRWPIILTGIIDTIYHQDHALGVTLESETAVTNRSEVEAKIREGKAIIEQVSKLKYEMARDRPLEPIPEDGEPWVQEYNIELDELAKKEKNTWFTAPWLYAECYLYRLLRSFFALSTHWRTFDPFFTQKQDTFKSSGKAIYQLATTMREMETASPELKSSSDDLEVIFKEMVQMCLWGNATDLSLLTHMSQADIADLQAVGRDAQAARREFILKDDQHAVWDYIRTLKNGRVDFVLDNAGFELFTDFVFADFLVTYTPYVSKVVFHPKMIPWFVSDVTPPDFQSTIPSLLSETFFSSGSDTPSVTAESHAALQEMVGRWKKYLETGAFALSVPPETPLGGKVDVNDGFQFWTGPWPYWELQAKAPRLFNDLQSSQLVIFKGDLNYRKLTGDVQWPVSTTFADAVGPLGGAFPILSLRTNKADVVVGVPQEVADKLDAAGEKWRVNGRYALVSFLPAQS